MANAPIQQVELGLIVAPEDFNTRRSLGDLTDLMSSIQSRGIDTPLLGKDKENGTGEIELFAGFRRYAAAKELGLKTVPVRVWPRRAIAKQQMLIANIVENVQREDLNPVDEALAFQRLQDEHKLGVDEIAAQLGMKKARVMKRLRILHLEEPLKEAIHLGEISVASAFEIDRLPKDKQKKYLSLAKDFNGSKLVKMIDVELEKMQGQLNLEKKEKKEKPEGDKSEYTKKIRKCANVIAVGLGYEEVDREAVKAIDFKVLDETDLPVVTRLFDDLSSLVEDDIEVNEKAKEAFIQTVEGAAQSNGMTLNLEHPEVRQFLIKSLLENAKEKAKEAASGSSKRPKVTFVLAQEIIESFYKKA